MEPIGNNLKKYQVPNGTSKVEKPTLPVAAVDELADELVKEYSNDLYRRWYCGIIYEFGFATVNEWRTRAASGKQPARLFSKYVRDARTYNNPGKRN